MNAPQDKPELLAAYEAEYDALCAAEPVTFQIGRAELVCLIAAVQLAFRHPRYTGASSAIVRDIIRQMADRGFEGFPAARTVIERGWDPRYDDPVERPHEEGALTDERFSELLNGPLAHPLIPFRLTRLTLALRAVVDATGAAGVRALESHCREREQQDGRNSHD
jgi:hypothetical protein